ncbi:hypothetical protein RHGRI_009686 [Rhododendron griersonianum]|uniref:Uncharacterized protein n=2 Tax=Rhododendron griersonianum TaxID=479676 RepID=A0AAV6KGU9_9ERIC|nr:hypothetical protein RHGRI_009686 [Rhododendron griersonianum]
MALFKTVSLAFFVLLICCKSPSSEARVLLSKEKEVPSMEDSLILSALPKGTTPRSSPSHKGHAMATINERLYVLPIPHTDRVLESSNPSPSVGH